MKIVARVLYVGSLIVTLPVLGFGVLWLLLFIEGGPFDWGLWVFASTVVGGVLGITGLAMDRYRNGNSSTCYFVGTSLFLFVGILTCSGITLSLLHSQATAWLALPLIVLAMNGSSKLIGLFRPVLALGPLNAAINEKKAPAPGDAPDDATLPPSEPPSLSSEAISLSLESAPASSDPAAKFCLLMAILLAFAVVTIHLT